MIDTNLKKSLETLSKSPWYKWELAFGLKRPKWWQVWKIKKFKIGVEATIEAIIATLRYDLYPSEYIPRVDAKLENGMWKLIVHYWGNPLNRNKW